VGIFPIPNNKDTSRDFSLMVINTYPFHVHNRFLLEYSENFTDHKQRDQLFTPLINCMEQYYSIQPFATNEIKNLFAEFIMLLLALDKYSDEITDYKPFSELSVSEKQSLKHVMKGMI
jgi:hypothetical protein